MQKTNKVEEGFANLIDNYIEALDENSKEMVKMLKSLQGKELSVTNKKALERIKRGLAKVDRTIDKMGK